MQPFSLIATDANARSGLLQTAHGAIRTPVFMPVGTLGTVKALSPEELRSCGAQVILGNTYHLYLRPGCEVIEAFSGLHGFMNWPHPILTDSGGFQIFSLARLTRISEEGAAFQSHIDGSRHLLTPEKAMEIQICLGSDIAMCLDQCLQYPAAPDQTRSAMDLTTRWARRCKEFWSARAPADRLLFGIVQGGMDRVLRAQSAAELVDIDFPGYALGGLSVGEPTELMLAVAAASLPLLPVSRCRSRRAQCPQRPAADRLWYPQHRQCPLSAGLRPRRPRLRLLHLPALLARLPAPPLPQPRTAGLPAQLDPQPALLCRVDGGHASGHRSRRFRPVQKGVLPPAPGLTPPAGSDSTPNQGDP